MRFAFLFLAIGALFNAPAAARDIVNASAPQDLSVTVYRNPDRGVDDAMERDWPEGFAMISEVRTVTLPAGQSTIRFEGVAEGMVAVSAIVTGLPGGTIEKNRNADLLSPAALLDGTLGNRVQITRMNPATGVQQTDSAIVRTRADGGLVLQTGAGYEAVRCSGLPETLTFDRIPDGLSSDPIFSIDTRDDTGGTYQVTLTYLAWGFDWEAHYVATLNESGGQGKVGLNLLSWLTILNDNGQSFDNAELMAVAGTINITSDFEGLSNPPTARPLRLTCYPLGSTAAGTPIPQNVLYAPPPVMEAMMDAGGDTIIVTGTRMQRSVMEVPAPVAMMAKEEQLGDLKLYRIPERVTVSAQGLKQVAFLNKEAVRGEFLYKGRCTPYDQFSNSPIATELILKTKNDEEHGLGVAMPMGGFTLFEPSSAGDLLVNEQGLRDYAVGQDIEISLGESTNVFAECAQVGDLDPDEKRKGWLRMQTQLSNANSHAITVRLVIGFAGDWEIRSGRAKPRIKDGEQVIELTVPAGKTREFKWKLRRPNSFFADS